MADFARITTIRGEGAVFAVDAQGNTRRLQEGDVLQQGETIRTTGTAQVELMMEDGRSLAVLPEQSLRLDEQVADTDTRPDAAAAAVAAPSAIDEVIQALDRGVDLSTQLEATAAGLGGGAGGAADGGNSFVQLLRITEAVDPVSYDYGFAPLQPPPGVEGTPEVDPNDPPSVVFRPNEGPDAAVAIGQVSEAGLPDGSDADASSEQWTGQFVLSDPDGLSDIQSITIVGALGSQTVAIGSVVGAVFQGASGTLEITAYDPVTGVGSYLYTLTGATTDAADAAETDVFTVTVTDGTDTSAPANLTIFIVDDLPEAAPNTNSVAEGGVVTGNVLTDDVDDVFGADGAAGSGVVGVRAAGGDTTSDVTTGVGATIAGLYGTLTLGANGAYTYDGDPNVVPAEGASDVFVYTIKDGDGDLSTTTLTINLSDSGLVAPADNDVTVYENALDTAVTGSDLAAGSVTGSLPGSSAETDASNQLNATGGVGTLTYSLLGGGTTAAGTYGTISISSNGSYIYTLTSPYDTSPDADNGANTESGKDSFTYQVTDANGNTATGTITVSIVDDVPVAYVPTEAVILNGLGGTETESLNSLSAIGADRYSSGTKVIFDSAQEGATSLTSGGQAIYLWVSADGKTLVGSTSSTEVAAGHESVVFTVAINDATDTYSVTMSGMIDNNSGSSFADLSGTGEAGNPGFKIVESTSGDDLEILFTPLGSATTVNSDSDDVAAGSQFISSGDGLRIDFGKFRNETNGTGKGSDDTPFIEEKSTVNGFRFSIDQISAGSTVSLILAAYDDNEPSDQNLANDTPDTITRIEVYASADSTDPIAVWDGTDAILDPGISITFTPDGDTVKVGGLLSGYSIATFTDLGYDSLSVTNGATAGTDGKFSLSNLEVGVTDAGNPVYQSFDTILTDADGDTSTGTIDVTFAPSGSVLGTSGDDDLTASATAGSDMVFGGEGDDLIAGGAGNDYLHGGPGADVFKWSLGDAGTAVTPAADVIGDFTAGTGGDTLDLRDLLTGETAGTDQAAADNLATYLHFTEVGGNVVVQVDPNGGTFAATQTITFEGVSISSLEGALGLASGATDAAIIKAMLEQGNLRNT